MNRGNVELTILLRSDAMLQVAECLEITTRVRAIITGRRGTDIRSLADVSSLTRGVGLIYGGQYSKAFDDDDRITKHRVNSYQHLIKMLMKQRVDAVVGVDEALYRTAESMGYSQTDFGEAYVLGQREGCLFFNRRLVDEHRNVLPRLRQATRTLRENGVLDRIEQSWTKP